MARKNIFELKPLARVNDGDAQDRPTRPLADVDINLNNRAGALGAISKSLERISARSEQAEEIQKQLTTGQTVVELETALVDRSFISDRLGVDDADQDRLIEQISQMGQLVPILVRPHPDLLGRYQIAYGHRRVAAMSTLGRKVRAIVKEMSDEELVIYQGQENNARSDLSFIEKAFFASELEKRGYSRETIHRSTGIDKAILSKMISFVKTIPEEVVRKIGRAPEIGRKRWQQFIDALSLDGATQTALVASKDPALADLTSDDRFRFILAHMKRENISPASVETIKPSFRNGVQPVAIQQLNQRVVLSFDERVSPGFADLVRSRLEALYSEYEAMCLTPDR